mmetsp:Transcript_10777/g.35881  ORF Transcript_10777/g.35881 Transcript_10777/m.35881 type:complete len:251 (+) Transcript_10777:539-1291(+)
MPSSVENARTTYRTHVGSWNSSRFLRDISSMTLETPRTSTPSAASCVSMRLIMSSRAFSRSSSSDTSPYNVTNSALTRSRIFDGPPPPESCRSINDKPSVTPEERTCSSLSGGVKPRFTKSCGTSSRLFVLMCAMNSSKAYCRSFGTWSVMPQSKMHKRPSRVRSRLPGCGSQCSVPVSSNMVKYALMATPQSRGTSGDADASRRVPSIHSVTRMFRRKSSLTTRGATTAPRPRAFMAAENSSVLRASAK